MHDFLEKLEELERLAGASLDASYLKERLVVDRFELSHLRRLARALSDPAREVVRRAGLTFAHARAIARLPARDQESFARDIVQKRWSVRKAEQAAAARVKGEAPGPDREYYEQLSTRISEYVGHPVEVDVDKKNPKRGVIKITYADLDCFDSIMQRLRVSLD